MSVPVLEARGLRKRYGPREVVQGVDLSLAPGDAVALLGPNGAGKTTTVGMLCGLITPDAGEVCIQGTPIGADTTRLHETIGLVPQELALFEPLSPRHNLTAFGALHGLSGSALAQRVEAALDVAGLRDRAHDPVQTFSGGMKRRLNIACALLHKPAVLILDEPTVGVDPQSRNAIFDTLEHLRDAGHALLYSTHYMEEAERLCQRALIIDQGRVLAHGTLDALLAGMDLQARVTLVLAAPPTLEALDQLGAAPAVQSLHADGNTVSVGLHALQDVPLALQAAHAAGLRWRELHSERASLEALFLQLTGRALRD